MKKFLYITITFLFVVSGIFLVLGKQKTTVSVNNTSGFAKIITNNCYLLKEPLKSSEKFFLLEESYFVKVTEDVDLYYKVQYLNLEGYVLKSNISFVEEFPENPYLSGITFDISNSNRATLRSEPYTTTDNSVIDVIASGTKDITYFGKISGEEAITGLGNIWYYCCYQNESGNFEYGYIYSPLTQNLTSITENGENLTTVNISAFSPIDNLLYLNLTTKNIMIILISLPTLFILFLFFKPSKQQD